jgi:hypothetical protein
MRVVAHGTLLVLFALSALAQSGIARYSGKVREFLWQNPKVYIVFDVKQADGSVDMYRLQCGSPADALRYGLSRNSLKPGDAIVVEVDQDRASRNFGRAITILPGGRKVRDCVLE